jgi:phosphoenolpyruvate-protein kinase (PTS system EI component)
MLVNGLPGAPGVAVGPVWRFRATGAGTAPGRVADDAGARAVFEPAAQAAARQLEALGTGLRGRGAENEAEILEAQALMAGDPALLDEAVRLAAAGSPPLDALRTAAEGFAASLARLDDPLLAARAVDVLDVADRIARVLLGVSVAQPDRPSIAVADDLPPSVTAELPQGSLLGIALEASTPLAHAAILARALGIPAVVAAPGLRAAVDRAGLAGGGAAGSNGFPRTPGRDASGAAGVPVVLVDGDRGEVIVAPTDAQCAERLDRATAAADRRTRGLALRDRPAATADGTRVRLLANIGSPRDIARALTVQPDGVGLLRTEFLFMERSREPTEAEQVEAYREILEAFGSERPVVVRLADIGGDKQIPYLDLPAEANPFLGVRAIRLAYRTPDLLVRQLRAISRAAAAAGVTPHVMAPMVATLADVALFESLCATAQSGLAADGLEHAERFIRGIMVEIPSAALLAPELARRVEFFSIGTNDLTQYVLAADRTNAALAELQDALHPAVLRAVAAVVAGGHGAGIPVAVCGELAGDPAGALVLVGLGVDELSADPNSLDPLRAALASATKAELEKLAEAALQADDAASVRRLAGTLLERTLAA